MPGHSEYAVDRGGTAGSARLFQRYLFLSSVLQFALRAVLTVFVAGTLMSEPPKANLSICVAILVLYALIVGCWVAWALRTAARAVASTRTLVTLLVLAADVAVVSVLSVFYRPHLTRGMDVKRDEERLLLDPVDRGSPGLDPVISAVVADPYVVRVHRYVLDHPSRQL